MRGRSSQQARGAINPVHAILIASTIPLLLGGVLSNWAYAATQQIQWTNFASWLVAGSLVFAGLALVWAIVELLAARTRAGAIYAGLVLATFAIGFLTALMLAKDAWGAMPGALILSIATLILAVAANWAAYWGRTRGAMA